VAIIIFDIETGPLSEEQVLAISGQPPELSHPGEFSPNSVKLGVMKDPAKIEAKVAEARAKHEAAVAAYEENKAKALTEWKESSMRSAALSAVTGQVLAVGFRASNGKVNIQMGNEQEMLAQFWGLYARARSSSTKLAGHCIFQFDLPGTSMAECLSTRRNSGCLVSMAARNTRSTWLTSFLVDKGRTATVPTLPACWLRMRKLPKPI